MSCKYIGLRELVCGPQGTFVYLGTASSGTDYSYKGGKLFQSSNIIDAITYWLNLTDACKEEVKHIIDEVTEGKMVSRVVELWGLELPEFDITGMMERTIKSFSQFNGFDKDELALMIKQGNFMLQCAINWFLTIGRRLGPIRAAILAFVAELNGIKVKIEDIAVELSMVFHICKKRHNELLETLVKVAQKLPCGKEVNAKNILKNAHFVIQYMEMKSMAKTGVKMMGCKSGGLYLDDAIRKCFTREVEYGIGAVTIENDLQYYPGGVENEIDDSRMSSVNELENLKISPETLASLHQKFKTDVSDLMLVKVGENNVPSSLSSGHSGIQPYDWWSGVIRYVRKALS
ncbi:hypothetical protein Ancab_005413 [Ancistrocladus abbreviatus]